MKLTHGRNAEQIARANTALLMELIKRLKANGVLNEEEAKALFENAAQFLTNYKGTKGVANVQEAAKMAREMVELV
jgi:hypothetical protein